MDTTKSFILSILVIFSLVILPIALGSNGWEDGWSNPWDDGWSDPWDDGTSNPWDDGTSNPWDDNTIDDGGDDGNIPNDGGNDPWDDPADDIPAVWNLLDDQSVEEDSPDGTVVYANLRNECIDDDPVIINIVNHVPNYDLAMNGDNLVINNLDLNYWDNGEIVSLSCNGVASFFKLTITSVDDGSGSSPQPKEDKDKLGIFVSSIRVNSDGMLNSGDVLEAYITVKNSGTVDLDNVKITMVIQDMAARGVVGSFDLNDGETTTKRVWLVVEEDAVMTEEVYDVRFTVSNDNARRVVYREVDVDWV